MERCTLPLTGVARVYTSHADVDVEDRRFVLRKKLPSIAVEELQAMTGATLVLPDLIADLVAPEL